MKNSSLGAVIGTSLLLSVTSVPVVRRHVETGLPPTPSIQSVNTHSVSRLSEEADRQRNDMRVLKEEARQILLLTGSTTSDAGVVSHTPHRR